MTRPCLTPHFSRTVKRYLFCLLLGFLILPTASALAEPEVYFSPNGGIRHRLLRAINHAKATIDLAIFDLTSGELAGALLAAKSRGVDIRIVTDARQARGKHSEIRLLLEKGIRIRLTRGNARGIMHHKFAIFDGKLLVTGSYNWTDGAERLNYENILVLDDSAIVKRYQVHFERLFNSVEARFRLAHQWAILLGSLRRIPLFPLVFRGTAARGSRPSRCKPSKAQIVRLRFTLTRLPFMVYLCGKRKDCDSTMVSGDKPRRAKVVAVIALLAEQGPNLPFPYSSQVRGKIRELRTRYGKERYRVLSFGAPGRIFVLLHALEKSTEKIRERDIKIAEDRMKKYRERLEDD